MPEDLTENLSENTSKTGQSAECVPNADITGQNSGKRGRTLLILLGVCYLEIALTIAFKFAAAVSKIPLRITVIYVIYVLMIAVIVIVCSLERKPLAGLGFSRKRLLSQIIIGVSIAVFLSFLLGVLPILIWGPEVSLIGGKLSSAQEAAYQIFTNLVFIGTVEELLFRGYIQTRLGMLIGGKYSKTLCALITGAIFGLWHIINGFWLQVAAAFVIGSILGLLRAHLKNYTLLSAIITHGMYNALLVVVRLILL